MQSLLNPTVKELWKSVNICRVMSKNLVPCFFTHVVLVQTVQDVFTNLRKLRPANISFSSPISQLRSHRAPGICGITAELLKAGGSCCTEWLTNIIRKAWDTGSAHDDWKKGIILPFYKGKGSRTYCRNYTRITLLSVPGKVYAHTILNRIKAHLHHLRRTKQSGFTPHRSTIDRIATLNMILQTRREYRKPSCVLPKPSNTSIFDQLSTLLTDSPCGCFFDPRVFQRRYSSF